MNKIQKIPFAEAYLNVPVGKSKINERDYLPKGKYKIVDQGKNLIAGFSNVEDHVKQEVPYILFGDHTKVVKFIDFPFIVGADGVRLYKAAPGFNTKFLYYYLKGLKLPSDAYGRHSKYLDELFVPRLDKLLQERIVRSLQIQFVEVENAKSAIEIQLKEVDNLGNALIYESLNKNKTYNYNLTDVLDEVKNGIGENWKDYPVYGATRQGLALAKEPPGKKPQTYKPVTPGTVFYNPMRILIGSIAFAEEDVEDGITSPDYVVLKGKEGKVNSRW